MAIISNPRGPRVRPGATTLSLWLRHAARDEVLFAAQTALMAEAQQDNEEALARLALSMKLTAMWGEEPATLRARINWRARWFYRVMPLPDEPPIVLRWWARLVNRLPVSWRPRARKAIDWWRA